MNVLKTATIHGNKILSQIGKMVVASAPRLSSACKTCNASICEDTYQFSFKLESVHVMSLLSGCGCVLVVVGKYEKKNPYPE